MPQPTSIALMQALGMAPREDPSNALRATTDATRQAIAQIVGMNPLADIARTQAPVLRQPETRVDIAGIPHRVGAVPSRGAPPRGSGRFNESQANQLPAMFGLRMSGAGRTDERNRQVGGAANSRHLFRNGARARDYVGSAAQMQRAASWARANGASEVLIHNAGSGTHLHVGWD